VKSPANTSQGGAQRIRGPPHSQYLVSFLCMRMRVGTPRRSGHQVDVDFVEPLCVDIELDIGQAQVRRNLGSGIPEDALSVTCSAIHIDVHVELLLAGDDRRVNQGRAGDFVPQISW
jgi:hypothetical protein